VISVASRDSLVADPQPGAFDVSFVAPGGSASVAVTVAMVGRSYLMVQPGSSKYGQLLVSGQNTFVRVAPPPVSLSVTEGARVIFVCNDTSCSAAWIAAANAAGEVAPSAGVPFQFGPRAQYYSLSFPSAQRFHYVSPTLPNVGGVITVGAPSNSSDALPVRDVDLQCLCNFPACKPPLPCDANLSTVPPVPPYFPPVPSVPPQQQCSGLTSARCASIEGFGNVWGVATYGSDCGDNDGSMAQPFRSIGRAVCAASPGDVVFVDFRGTFREDMVVWDNCTSCVSFAIEDRSDSYLGLATLRGARNGTVELRKTSPDWWDGQVDIVWLNIDKFSRLEAPSPVFPLI
jgi:hypothetical protein